MTTTHTITHACGHTTEHEIAWDGRRKSVEEYLPDPDRPGYVMARPTRMSPGRAAAVVAERAYPPDEPCLACQRQAHREACERLAPGVDLHPWTFLPWLRAAARVARRTGGIISQSPKSTSLYVTWPTGAWRISDHHWPGREASLVSERCLRHARACPIVSRLTADWLPRELGRVA